jgi:hypothetical protein
VPDHPQKIRCGANPQDQQSSTCDPRREHREQFLDRWNANRMWGLEQSREEDAAVIHLDDWEIRLKVMMSI